MDGCLCAFFFVLLQGCADQCALFGGLSFVCFVGGVVFSVGLFHPDTDTHAKGAVFSWVGLCIACFGCAPSV